MTARPLINRMPSLAYSSAQVGRTVRGPHMMAVAEAANVCALGRPARGFNLFGLGWVSGGEFVASYARTHPAINQAVLEWTVRLLPASSAAVTATTESLSVSLTITDALGNSVASGDSRIPTTFSGIARDFLISATNPSGDPVLGGIGYLDLDALATTLTDPSWSFKFTIVRASGIALVVDRIRMRELARTVVDTSDAYGVDVADFQPGQPAGAGSITTTGTLRLGRTIDGAIASTDDVLVLGWEDVADGFRCPGTTSAAYAAFGLMEQPDGSGVPMRFRVPVRPMYVAAPPGDATGESARFRVRYYVDGGGTASVQLLTGSSGSPYEVTGLTGATWQWSAWVDCRLPTDGTDVIATLSLKGKTTAGALYLSGVHVQQT